MAETCLWHKCGKQFEKKQPNQKFCPGSKCKDAYNNDRKLHGHRLTQRNESKLQELADAQGKPIDEMLNEIVTRALNPDGQPLTDAEAHGVNAEAAI